MSFFSVALACFGVFILAYRLREKRGGPGKISHTGEVKTLAYHAGEALSARRGPGLVATGDSIEPPTPPVSVIIPARNEAHNLPRLLSSLQTCGYANLQIIVVDDESHDGTGDLARAAGVEVVAPPPLPEGWWGKNWACYNGAQVATGSHLLFTDADTEFVPGGIERLIEFQKMNNYGLVCPLPFHRCDLSWERWMGPFHCLYLVATAPMDVPRPHRLYANGQCLLFTRSCYAEVGHHAVGQRMPEDLTLAREVLGRGLGYGVYAKTDVYRVNMYPSVREFIAGWRRNLRFGMQQSELWSTVEVTAVLVAGLGVGKLWFSPLSLLILLATSWVIERKQRRYGNFTARGAWLAPFAFLVFCSLSVLAVLDTLSLRPTKWKGRSYP